MYFGIFPALLWGMLYTRWDMHISSSRLSTGARVQEEARDNTAGSTWGSAPAVYCGSSRCHKSTIASLRCRKRVPVVRSPIIHVQHCQTPHNWFACGSVPVDTPWLCWPRPRFCLCAGHSGSLESILCFSCIFLCIKVSLIHVTIIPKIFPLD